MKNLFNLSLILTLLTFSVSSQAGLFGPSNQRYRCVMSATSDGKTSKSNHFDIVIEKGESQVLKFGKGKRPTLLPKGYEWAEITLNDVKFYNPIFGFSVRPNVTIIAGSYDKSGKATRSIALTKTYKKHLVKEDILVGLKNSQISGNAERLKKLSKFKLSCRKIRNLR